MASLLRGFFLACVTAIGSVLLTNDFPVGTGLPAMAASQPSDIFLMHPNQTVGVSLLAMAAS